MSALVIVLEKELSMRTLISGCLRIAGIEVTEASDPAGASALVASHPECLLIVSDDLPHASMRSLLHAREQRAGSRCSIVMLTDKLKQHGAARGADRVDAFVPRAFSPEILVDSIEALLRRGADASNAVHRLHFSGLTLELGTRVARFGEQQAVLGPTECRLLRFMMGNADRVFSRLQLIERVWDSSTRAEERTIDVHILRLRRALTQLGCEHFVQTVPRFGYRFSAQVC